MTLTIWPATISVPLRDDDDVLAEAVNVTVPLAEPELPLVIASQPVLLDAVHEQPAPADT